jgi:hypothetical protein
MNSIKMLGPSLFFLAIQLRYQLVSSKQRVIDKIYSDIQVSKRISHKNLSKF